MRTAMTIGRLFSRAAMTLVLMVLTTATAWALDGITYIDENGEEQTANNVTVLTDGSTTLVPGWYVVSSDITITGTVTLKGEVNLILKDGCTMNVGTSSNRISGDGINGYDEDDDIWFNLDIYGQTNGTGALSIYTSGAYASSAISANILTINGGNITAYNSGLESYAIYAKDALTINRGSMTATATGRNSKGIYVDEGSVTINGGNVTATGDCYGIWAKNSVIISRGNVEASYSGSSISGSTDGIYTEGAITLGWTDYTDRIFASSYNSEDDDVTINGFFTDGSGNLLSGTVSLPDVAGKTLQPCLALTDNADNASVIAAAGNQAIAVGLQGRTLYKDGDWNTLCLPFAVSTASGPLSGDGVTAMTLNTSTSNLNGSTLTLNFDAAPTTIPAGTPFIIKWENTGEDIENPVFTGVTISGSASTEVSFTGGKFKGTFDPVSFNSEDKSVLFLGGGNKLYYPDGTATTTINAFRAYFQLNGVNNVKEFKLNFDGDEDEATPLLSPEGEDNGATPRAGLDGGIYDLSGRLVNLSTRQLVNSLKKGIYINNGKKILK